MDKTISFIQNLKKYSATKMLGGSKMQKTPHTHVLIKNVNIVQ